MKKIPEGTFVVIFGECISKFSYWGIQSILVIFLLKQYHLNKSDVFFIYGVTTTFGFASAFIGGVLGDKTANIIFTVKLGILYSIFGSMLLTLPDIYCFYIGIAFLVFGTGLISPNLDNLMAEIYRTKGQSSQGGYTILHGATNLGALLSPVVFGVVGITYGYSYCFILCALFYIIFLIFLFKISAFEKIPLNTKGNNIYLLFYIFPILIALSFNYKILFQLSLIGFGFYILIVIMNHFYKANTKTKWNILLFLGSAIIVLIFYSFELQFNNSILIYAENFFKLTVFGIRIPTNMLTALEPFFVVLLTTPVTYFLVRGYNKSLPIKDRALLYVFALLCCAIGFYFISAPFGIETYQKQNLIWLILAALMIAISDIILYPATLSILGDKIAKSIRGQFIGCLYLTVSFSGYFSGKIATIATKEINSMPNVYYDFSKLFLILTCIIFMLYMFQFIKKLSIVRLFNR